MTEFGFCYHGTSFRCPCTMCDAPYTARNRDTGEDVATFGTIDAAREHVARFPNDAIYRRTPNGPKLTA